MKLRKEVPDIIVLDLYIKKDNPVDNIQRLRNSFPSIPIVILTMEDSLFWQRKMFREGAKAYLLKEDSKETIKTVLIQVYQGKTVIPCEVQSDISQGVDSSFTTLTVPEREVIKHYTSGYSLKEIARMRGKSASTLDRMLQKIRRRVHARNLAELVKILFYNKEI